jgi:hypothetical protein
MLATTMMDLVFPSWQGDKTTPNSSGCSDGNCRFSGVIYQLWYLNALGQFSSAITNIQNGASALLPMIAGFPANTPWCLATGVHLNLTHLLCPVTSHFLWWSNSDRATDRQ